MTGYEKSYQTWSFGYMILPYNVPRGSIVDTIKKIMMVHIVEQKVKQLI